MTHVSITAKVVPYDVANSYNETIRPGAFKNFLKAFEAKGRPLPMLFRHAAPIGEWTRLIDQPDGLYAEGVIKDAFAVTLFRDLGMPREASITFKPDDDDDGKQAFTNARIEQIRDSGWRNRPLPPFVKAVDKVDVTEASLTEISLVQRGAFPDTHFDFV